MIVFISTIILSFLEIKMPLTDKQKTFLIFKEFTGLSDDSLLSNHENFHSKYIFEHKTILFIVYP